MVFYLYNGPLGTPRGAKKDRKRVSDAYPVNMGYSDHYVGFVNKFGAIQGFQRGKSVLQGSSRPSLTPLNTPTHPQNTPNPIIDHPYSQFNSSSYFKTHKHSHNPPTPYLNPKMQKMAKNGNVPPHMGLISMFNIICNFPLCMALINLVTLSM